MKVTAIVVAALATLGAASPAPTKPHGCTPGTYRCTSDAKGWQVCDTSNKWVFAGYCPLKTGCVYYKPSKSPYCVPPGFEFPQ
ncbi:hypothetical protein FZEAL_1519 [Fusarium zealandicum]|uniref:Uncharacterized protein n=1 Tax=Fusarium zealandicum TaxID=1053134 RepID=A0A8H4UTA1_9HYPO|nr:hypothetical protein FZEAL_1519 [Fusarium zealandicum]